MQAASTPTTTPPAEDARANFERTLGEVLLLLSSLPPYDNLFLSQITTRIVPPLVLKQFQVTRTPEGLIIGYTSWAMVTPALAEKLSADGDAADDLTREDWNCGGEKVIIDAVGVSEDALRELNSQPAEGE